MKKIIHILPFCLFFCFAVLVSPSVVKAQCAIEPSSLSIKDFCSLYTKGKYELFKMKVPKDLLNNYKDGINRVKLNIDSECAFEPDWRKDTTSDPNNVIFYFPTGEDNCLAQKYAPIIVKATYDPPRMEWAQSQVLCEAETVITPNSPSCRITVTPISGIGDVNSTWKVLIDQFNHVIESNCTARGYFVSYPDKDGNIKKDHRFELRDLDIPWERTFKYNVADSYEVIVASDNDILMCKTQFNVAPAGATPMPTNTPIPTGTPVPTLAPGQPTYTPVPPVPSLAPLCDQIDTQYSGKCWDCINKGRIWTAIGCLPTDFSDIINNYVFKLGIGIAGGISFLYFIYGVFLILTSAGNAEKITQAKEIIVSAISGLLLIIFSIFLLQVIGVDILKLPGFGK